MFKIRKDDKWFDIKFDDPDIIKVPDDLISLQGTKPLELKMTNLTLEELLNGYNDFVKLEHRIDRAIDYIKDKYEDDLFDDTLTQFEDKLLSILEGKDE